MYAACLCSTAQDIEAACRNMVGQRVGNQGQETVVLEGLLGEGSYGKVYKATWKGTVVAVKIMVLPSYMSGGWSEAGLSMCLARMPAGWWCVVGALWGRGDARCAGASLLGGRVHG